MSSTALVRDQRSRSQVERVVFERIARFQPIRAAHDVSGRHAEQRSSARRRRARARGWGPRMLSWIEIIGAASTMRSNHSPGMVALRRRMLPPIEWASPMKGGGQSGSTMSFMKRMRSRSYSQKPRTWPLRGFASMRCEPPCPRQSMVATAKPRRRKSAMTSKYFSMNSVRPPNRQTVPAPRHARRVPAGVAKLRPRRSRGRLRRSRRWERDSSRA